MTTAVVVRSVLIIVICGAVTFGERYLPFAIFGGREVPPVILYLGRLLPSAVIAALVVYCLRYTGFSALSGWVPPLAAAALTALLHLWRKNTLLSVVGGTVCYMLLVQVVFA